MNDSTTLYIAIISFLVILLGVSFYSALVSPIPPVQQSYPEDSSQWDDIQCGGRCY